MQGVCTGGKSEIVRRLPANRLPNAVFISQYRHFGVENAAEYGGDGSAHGEYSFYLVNLEIEWSVKGIKIRCRAVFWQAAC